MEMSRAAAKRIVLAAQGFMAPRPQRVTMAELTGMYSRIGLTQIDSVNVLVRAHFLPAYSRLGPYNLGIYDRASKGTPPKLVEYWAHEAALVTPQTWHWLRWRMAAYERHPRWREILDAHPRLVERILAAITDEGAMSATHVHQRISHTPGVRANWGWNWSDEKRVLEALFATGRLTVAVRNAQFERLYDLPERVLGPLDPAPSAAQAVVELLRIAIRALGIATARSIQDYFRMRADMVRQGLEFLVEREEIEQVDVEGWGPAFLDPEARRPRKVEARTLLAPFDPLVFDRERLESLFGMRYRIGLYTPAERRTHGYYALPFLLGEDVVGWVDLKADRQRSVLLVQQLSWQPDAPAEAPSELEAELRLMAEWLELHDVARVR